MQLFFIMISLKDPRWLGLLIHIDSVIAFLLLRQQIWLKFTSYRFLTLQRVSDKVPSENVYAVKFAKRFVTK